MPVSLRCKGCKATLKVPDQFAGKKIKCPKCAVSLAVPVQDEEEFVTCEVMPDHRIKDAPSKKTKPTRSRHDEEDDDEEDRDDRRTRIKSDRDRDRDRDDDRRSSRFREEDDEDRRRKKKSRRDEDDEDDRRGNKGEFKPCPKCGCKNAKRVLWTAWGSFYGPAMFHHVRCPKCAYCYNGRSGRSNLLAATIFISVPLIGISAIIGAVVYMLFARGHL